MGWPKSADTILDDYNINGRRNQAPFNGVFLALYSYGFVGNILVVMVFRKRYSVPSPYRSLVTFLAFPTCFLLLGSLEDVSKELFLYSIKSDPITLTYVNSLASFAFLTVKPAYF